MLNKDATGKADGTEVEETWKAGKDEGQDDEVVVDTQFPVKFIADELAFGAAVVRLTDEFRVAPEADKTFVVRTTDWLALMPKLSTEDDDVTEIGLKPATGCNKDAVVALDNAVGMAKLPAGFDGLNTKPPCVAVATDGTLVTPAGSAVRDDEGKTDLNSLPATAAERVEMDDDNNGAVTATVKDVTTADEATGGLLTEC